MVAKPNSEGVIVVKYPGRILTSEEAANWVRGLNDKIEVLHHLIQLLKPYVLSENMDISDFHGCSI